jgi:arylsulfatase A
VPQVYVEGHRVKNLDPADPLWVGTKRPSGHHPTGQTLGEGACLDSMDVLDALLGKPGAKGRDHLVQQDNGSSGNFGFRVGDWKLVRFKKNENTKAVVSKPQDIPPPRPHTLYRLSEEYEANAAQDEQRTRTT